jgi:sugar phosphate permease
MILGSVVTGSMKEARNRRLVMLGVSLINGTLFLILGASSVFAVSLLVTVLQGVFVMTFDIQNTTLYQ